jgi:hypothetical protein
MMMIIIMIIIVVVVITRIFFLQVFSSLFYQVHDGVLIPVAARSKAWVYGRSLTGNVGSNPA